LRRSGLDAWIDQYETSPPQGWPIWMLSQIRHADFVLIVCSETYRRRFEGEEIKGKGKGAKFEGAVLTQAVYDAEQDNRKFIPLVVDPADLAHIPVALRSFTYFDVSDQLALESLYRFLTDQPSVVPPPVGAGKGGPEKGSGVFVSSRILRGLLLGTPPGTKR